MYLAQAAVKLEAIFHMLFKSVSNVKNQCPFSEDLCGCILVSVVLRYMSSYMKCMGRRVSFFNEVKEIPALA